MVDTSLITQFLIIPIIALCFVIGFVIKNYTKLPNKYIPLIMLVCGIIFNVILTITSSDKITIMTFISGAISGLASTGSYELIRNALGLNPTNKTNDESSVGIYDNPNEDDEL